MIEVSVAGSVRYLVLMDPDTGGPKTSGAGAGSATLIGAVSLSHWGSVYPCVQIQTLLTAVTYSSGFCTLSYLILYSLYQIERIQYRIRSDPYPHPGPIRIHFNQNLTFFRTKYIVSKIFKIMIPLTLRRKVYCCECLIFLHGWNWK